MFWVQAPSRSLAFSCVEPSARVSAVSSSLKSMRSCEACQAGGVFAGGGDMKSPGWLSVGSDLPIILVSFAR